MSNPIDELMSTAMQNLREMVDVNTIVGEPVRSPEGTIIIPVSKVAFGFAAGGSSFGKAKDETDKMFGGGSGGGVSISPIAFLVANDNQIKMMPVDSKQTPVDKVLDFVPTIIEKVNSAISKKEKKPEKDPTVTVSSVFEEKEKNE